MAVGERIFNLKRMYTVKCGKPEGRYCSRENFKQPRTEGGAKDNLPPLESMLEEYYPAGDGTVTGVPMETIDKLGLEWDL